jgi:hypothetical protein
MARFSFSRYVAHRFKPVTGKYRRATGRNIMILLSSCSDDEQVITTDPGYAYFPVEIGTFVSYRVDSIYHDQPQADVIGIHDTISYFLKEVIDSEFEDAEGESSLRLERFKKQNMDDEWVLSDVWFAKRSSNNAEKVEENRRYVKLGFPISEFSTWDGNALNNLEEWTYEYDSLELERTFNEFVFPNTITVQQRDFLTEVNDEYAYEIYAEDVGLIYRKHKQLFTRPSYLNNRVAENIISGNEFTWEIIDYGNE